jgi:phosphotransferase system enzyme I (PtsI)
MFPMIATVDEFKQAKEFANKTFTELENQKQAISHNIQIGMMVEIPAAAVLIDQFAKYADFFSIGTNDLIQYTFACDRMSPEVAYLYQPNNPSLLRLVKSIIDHAHALKKPVAMCGEMAGDTISIPILLGLGLDNFSMSVTSIPKARMIINNLSYQECQILANDVLKLENSEQVETVIKNFLHAKQLIS